MAYVLGFEGLYTKWLEHALLHEHRPVRRSDWERRDGRPQALRHVRGFADVEGDGPHGGVRRSERVKGLLVQLHRPLQKRFTTNFGGSIAYTYTQSYDVQGLTSSTAASQCRFGREFSGDQNDLILAHSAWETPHRVVGGMSYTFPSGTSLSMGYTGQSGVNFNYSSSGDLNGDGRTSNDPLYVPTGVSDPKLPTFRPHGCHGSRADQAAAFDKFISSQHCLNSQRGTIMKRNCCQSPWTNEFDMAVEQGFSRSFGRCRSRRP